SVSSFYAAESLGVPKLNWFEDLFGWMPAGITPVIAAAEAVANGGCDVALAFRTVKRPHGRPPPGIGFGARVGGDMQFRAPYGDTMTSSWLAMWARRHMHEYGTTEEHLGHVAITSRRHASLNPVAPLRDPITMDDYFASRMITTPFRLLDCDFPGDGAAVMTHGGSMSGGRLHAISHVVECVQQLRGECGERQVGGAEVGVVSAGGGTMAGALLLTADR